MYVVLELMMITTMGKIFKKFLVQHMKDIHHINNTDIWNLFTNTSLLNLIEHQVNATYPHLSIEHTSGTLEPQYVSHSPYKLVDYGNLLFKDCKITPRYWSKKGVHITFVC